MRRFEEGGESGMGLFSEVRVVASGFRLLLEIFLRYRLVSALDDDDGTRVTVWLRKGWKVKLWRYATTVEVQMRQESEAII